MKLSDVILENDDFQSVVVKNEREFETLALCGTDISIPFCTFIDDAKYLDKVSDFAHMILTTKELENRVVVLGKGYAVSMNPRLDYFKLHNYLAVKSDYKRKDYDTIISPTAEVSSLSCISKNNVTIGENCIIEPFVTIYSNVIIGDNVIIRSGARIGGEGFEYKDLKTSILAVNHIGGVIIGDNVEIQNNSCVDKAIYPWDDTVLGSNVKIDNLVHIAHGVKIGDCTMVVANSGIGGRTVIGDNSWIGFSSTIRNGITLGKNARVNMGAVVTKAVMEGESVTGNFAIDHKKFIENLKRQDGNTNGRIGETDRKRK